MKKIFIEYSMQEKHIELSKRLDGTTAIEFSDSTPRAGSD